MSYVSREIRTRQCYCSVFGLFSAVIITTVFSTRGGGGRGTIQFERSLYFILLNNAFCYSWSFCSFPHRDPMPPTS